MRRLHASPGGPSQSPCEGTSGTRQPPPPPLRFNGNLALGVAWVGRQVGLSAVPPLLQDISSEAPRASEELCLQTGDRLRVADARNSGRGAPRGGRGGPLSQLVEDGVELSGRKLSFVSSAASTWR